MCSLDLPGAGWFFAHPYIVGDTVSMAARISTVTRRSRSVTSHDDWHLLAEAGTRRSPADDRAGAGRTWPAERGRYSVLRRWLTSGSTAEAHPGTMADQISHQDADASPSQDLIVQEPGLSRPFPGTACLARWATDLSSGRSQVTASLRRYLRPGRRRAQLAALLAAVTAAALVAV